ncbi:MAG TPA: cysteine--tRNA ligase, partial [Acidimicrobiales bacterium]|nr:cysteine--tRNA ligase [Acidimicrobiales bacterium]
DIVPSRPGRFSMYVCGPTVYDLPHMGHGRTMLVYDVLRRYLEWTGVDVDHVSNITDIDDNIIERAQLLGRTPEDVAEQYEAEHWAGADGLGVLRPKHAPHATEYVGDMIELVGELEGRGFAYETDDGLYLSSESVPGYGLLAQQPLESLRAGARVEEREGKRSPVDFAVWKRAKEGEPAWPSPWGPGRPGWHTECVVMSLDLLGEGFDLHTGGLDLKFPHHENERAQAVALGHEFARHWMHHAFIEVGGQKMSKSLGNFTSLSDLLSREDGRAYRLLVLQSHYRTPLEVTPDTIARATKSLEGLDLLAARLPEAFSGAGAGPPQRPPADETEDVIARFRSSMDDDLDTPAGVSLIFEGRRRANAAADDGRAEEAARWAAAAASMMSALGLAARPPDRDQLSSEIVDLVARLDAARSERDFATADAVRAELGSAGWVVETGSEGTRVRRRER